MIIPQNSFEDYECCEQGVIAVPEHIKRLGGRFVGIEIFKIDSWRVKGVLNLIMKFIQTYGISTNLLVFPHGKYLNTLRWNKAFHLSDTQLQRSV